MEIIVHCTNGVVHLCVVLLNEVYAHTTQEKSTFEVPMGNNSTRMHNGN